MSTKAFFSGYQNMERMSPERQNNFDQKQKEARKMAIGRKLDKLKLIWMDLEWRERAVRVSGDSLKKFKLEKTENDLLGVRVSCFNLSHRFRSSY